MTRRAEAIEILHAAAQHIDAVHELETECFPAPWRREFFESELHASGRLNLVALRSQQVIGYLFAMWFFDEMHINKIAVAEAERRQGVALALMQECLSFAAGRGIKVLSLEVRQSNQGAQDFYRRLEFEPAYLRPRYYPDGESAVVMSKTIE
ncbi:MAG: ribosomal protein S18-alanine N-acetyltransferase [Thermoanaerobaculia bacterium]